ncbi:MAG: glycosyltransferase [Pigmentiphaga sp.]|nr:glycosyltransferase [Pigmentiphaga sp.]
MSPAARITPQPILFHIRHFGVGGIEAALLGWLKGLDRSRFAPALSIFLPTREWREVYREQLPDDIPVHVVIADEHPLARRHQARRDGRLDRLGRLQLSWQLQSTGRRALRRHLRYMQERYPVVVDFDHTLRKLAPMLKVPVLAVRHFAFWDEASAKARRVGHDLLAYDRVLVLNDDMRLQAEHLYGPASQRGPRCTVVPNLFDLDGMRRKAAAGLPAGDWAALPYAVCVARLDIPTKGLDTLVRAWRRMVDAEPAARLIVVGDGSDRAELQRQIDAAGLSANILLAGMQVNPYPWIARARLLVSSSRTEGASNVLIEALALGTPVVATDCPVGASDTLEAGRCGALVPVDDTEALAGTLLQAWHNAEWREVMREAGMRRALDFSQEKGSERLGRVVAEVLGERELTAPAGRRPALLPGKLNGLLVWMSVEAGPQVQMLEGAWHLLA